MPSLCQINFWKKVINENGIHPNIDLYAMRLKRRRCKWGDRHVILTPPSSKKTILILKKR